MKPLDSLAKRDLLAARKYNPDTVRAYADQFLQQELYGDAFAFYQKLSDEEGVRRVMNAAVEQAETDVLWLIERAYPKLMTREQWTKCGENAMRMGKYRCAAYVFRRIGDDARLTRAEKNFMPAAKAPPDNQSPPQP